MFGRKISWKIAREWWILRLVLEKQNFLLIFWVQRKERWLLRENIFKSFLSAILCSIFLLIELNLFLIHMSGYFKGISIEWCQTIFNTIFSFRYSTKWRNICFENKFFPNFLFQRTSTFFFLQKKLQNLETRSMFKNLEICFILNSYSQKTNFLKSQDLKKFKFNLKLLFKNKMAFKKIWLFHNVSKEHFLWI